MSSVPVGGSKHGSVVGDPFVVLESDSTQDSSSSRVFPDPLEESSKRSKSRSTRAEASSGGGRGFDDLDPLNSSGKPTRSISHGRDAGGKEGSPSRSASPQFVASRVQMGDSSSRYSESNLAKKTPQNNFQKPPLYDMPNASADYHKSFDQTAASQIFEASSQVDMSQPSSGLGQQSDDVWLSVSEIPLFTQPTVAPPPSRPPPPIPHHKLRAEKAFSYSSSRRKGDKYPSPSNHTQHSQSPKLSRPVTKGQQLSQSDELDDFAQGRFQNSFNENANLHSTEDTNAFSANAAASAAAMKEAVDKAEVKFKHAKEVREREYAKAAKYKEPVQLEKDEQDDQERDMRESNERLEHERKQKEEEEREQIRLQREREKGRQAVERANREARERAAIQARERAAAEVRLRAERAAVEKATVEARGRAEKVAVQRVQAEARERAATEARGRVEKTAAEARERASAAETKEKEIKEKAFVARAEGEARGRAQRAAVDRAATEARERAAAAAAAKMNQQRNDDDVESFFSTGRASSAPKAREKSAVSDRMMSQISDNEILSFNVLTCSLIYF